MKVFFNGWFSGFFDKTNSGCCVEFFLELFKNVYNEDCYIGTANDSDILCEFDMLIDCPGTFINHKKWKQTYLFNGESTMRCNPDDYDIVMWGERNHKHVVNVPLFIPYIYTNKFVDLLTNEKKITKIPEQDCCVIITNPGGQMRNSFLNKLEQSFKVTYAGGYKNNIGASIQCPYNSNEYFKFIGQFKFIITMENSRNETYITEKLINGLLANTIPVYWGSLNVFDYFNDKRFLNLIDESSIDNVIYIMKEISVDNEKWIEMVNQPNFINNKLERTMNEIADDINV